VSAHEILRHALAVAIHQAEQGLRPRVAPLGQRPQLPERGGEVVALIGREPVVVIGPRRQARAETGEPDGRRQQQRPAYPPATRRNGTEINHGPSSPGIDAAPFGAFRDKAVRRQPATRQLPSGSRQAVPWAVSGRPLTMIVVWYSRQYWP
jgi:hypothetical protein